MLNGHNIDCTSHTSRFADLIVSKTPGLMRGTSGNKISLFFNINTDIRIGHGKLEDANGNTNLTSSNGSNTEPNGTANSANGAVSSSNSGSTGNEQNDIDESLYSRQLYVLGHEAMTKMSKSKVLLVGLRGLGVEIG